MTEIQRAIYKFNMAFLESNKKYKLKQMMLYHIVLWLFFERKRKFIFLQ